MTTRSIMIPLTSSLINAMTLLSTHVVIVTVITYNYISTVDHSLSQYYIFTSSSFLFLPFYMIHCLKKFFSLMFDNNFGNCGPIFKILSP